MRQLLEEWKTAPHAERAVEAALSERLSAARNVFTKRRKAYLAGLEEQRESIRIRKEKLVADAESLATSTAWGPTAGTFRDLMREWKAAGRAGREAEEDLWARFKAAQDQFFAARAEALSEKETGLREHAAAKQELLEQAASRIAAPPARLVPSEGIETLARLAGRLEGSDTALVVDAETGQAARRHVADRAAAAPRPRRRRIRLAVAAQPGGAAGPTPPVLPPDHREARRNEAIPHALTCPAGRGRTTSPESSGCPLQWPPLHRPLAGRAPGYGPEKNA